MMGAFHALANAARFLEDAAVLYENRRRSSSYLSTVAAREELGRFNLLWRAVVEIDDGLVITAKELRGRLRPSKEAHHAKLQAGQSMFFFQGALPVETFVERQSRYSEMRKTDSRITYEHRLSEQYVDLSDDGSWSVPGKISLRDVLMFIWVVTGEVGGALLSGEDDHRFSSALSSARVSLPLSMGLQNRIFSLPQFDNVEP
jgi:AbiV family abortive infection protein